MTTPIAPSITEEQLINLDCCDEYSLRHMHGEVGLLIDSYRALQERLRDAEKDAARYRWIRDQHNDAAGRTWVSVYLPDGWVSLDTFAAGVKAETLNLDVAVDAAMELQP